MKPFNLEEALAGNPVRLRDGRKAYIAYVIPSEYYSPTPLSGYYLKRGYHSESGLAANRCCWKLDGRTNKHEQRDGDIIGMWEEPTPTVMLTLPKPFKPKQNETYYSISDVYNEPVEQIARCLTAPSILNGNCFRKEEDAQAWIDAMKDAVYE